MQKILADTLGLGRARNVNNKEKKKTNSQLMISLNEISNSDNCFHDVDYQGQKVLFFNENFLFEYFRLFKFI